VLLNPINRTHDVEPFGGTFALQWLDVQRLARTHVDDLDVFLVALAFLGLGIDLGARVLGRSPPAMPCDGNPRAQTALGISARECTVPHEPAAGRSNKEITARPNISPNTVKARVARLYGRLGAAVKRSRPVDLGSKDFDGARR
jgi:DNA-binding CsgD family transcriptional regulator